jgi:hypothetical protein
MAASWIDLSRGWPCLGSVSEIRVADALVNATEISRFYW